METDVAVDTYLTAIDQTDDCSYDFVQMDIPGTQQLAGTSGQDLEQQDGDQRNLSQFRGDPPLEAQPGAQRGAGELALPMRRCSSTHSSIFEASSVGAPHTHTQETLYCLEQGCSQSFTGLYRRGNLARHRRLKHGKGKPYVCEDLTCAKEFQRQDARLKHYRKWHRELAASSPFVPRSTASRTAAREQEFDLSNVSSWVD